MISLEEFRKLASAANVIPLVRSRLADLHTPVSAYLALREQGKGSFLFESVERDEKIGRFSFVGVDPLVMIRARQGGVEISGRGGNRTAPGSIFDALAAESGRFRQAEVPGLDGFLGGFVGYIGYGAVARLEKLSLRAPGGGGEDEAMFGLFGSLLRFDHRRQIVLLVHNVLLDGSRSPEEAYREGRKALEAMELKFLRPVPSTRPFACDVSTPEESIDREGYCRAVTRAKEYITEGDIFQVVLSRRVSFPYTGDLFAVYRALRMINPSPYLFHIDFGETQLAGSSPEVLVRVSRGMVEVLPIAGTRPRGETQEEDEQMEQDLLSDQKELAEHVMLVDLGRNDVGRISRFGSVRVPVFKRVERYSHVMHIVSEVRGTLSDGAGPLEALKACFPAGTVSGAPKVRAMEIINELEPASRGVYAGAVGYLAFNGSLDTCIAIRTIVGHRGTLSIQAGAGIVADSVPESEYHETLNKSRALLEAVREASGGLRAPGVKEEAE
ncbi:MAG TPA: anthranilate synthase component I [Bacteroidota bacterium]|nr:anthranilate synthase component I [Bacteroidota bacterium]